MFSQIFVEKDLSSHPQVEFILKKLNSLPVHWIDRYDDYWGKFKKPYLHKRDSLSLFLANKKGQLVKKTPDAYGINRGDHYYFIHAFNCIYECQYCYLQGHFKTPDIVLFLNHQDILDEMQSIVNRSQDEVWFHAGEYSDSLALTHLTGELPLYFDFFKNNQNAFLELRSKSVNVRELVKLAPLPNVVVSFSLSPDEIAREIDLKTPSIKARLKAMEELSGLGFKLGIHFDPIIIKPNVLAHYSSLIGQMKERHLLDAEYISLGVVRFTENVYHEVKNNYPESIIFGEKMIKSFDEKLRYIRPVRLKILNEIQTMLMESGVLKEKIYFCME
jgi:spore photoproduct lyase